MKRILAYVLALVLTLAIFLPAASAAPSTSPSASTSPSEDASASPSEDASASPSSTASGDTKSDQPPEYKYVDSVMLVDVKTKENLISHNVDKQVKPASTTKILTSLLVLEKEKDLSKKVTTTNDVMDNLNKESSLVYAKVGIKPGEVFTVEQLLYGMMVVSGNDAANALAIDVGGSIDGFVQLMNQRAQELGMKNSKFANPHGINNESHLVTAQDMKTLTLKALENPQWQKYFTAKKFSMPKTNKHEAVELETTDKLLSSDPADQDFHYDYAIGGKTGLTPSSEGCGSNGCLVALAEKDGRKLLCLIFGDHKTTDDRFKLAKNLFIWGFKRPTTVDVGSILAQYTVSEKVNNVSDLDENEGKLDLAPDMSNGFNFTGTEDQRKAITSLQGITSKYDLTKPLTAPIKKDEVYGTITFYYNGEAIGSTNLIASRDVAAAGEEVSGAAAANSPSSPVKVQQKENVSAGGAVSLWWLLLLPAILGIIIVFRVISANKRHRSRFKNKRKVYNYRIR